MKNFNFQKKTFKHCSVEIYKEKPNAVQSNNPAILVNVYDINGVSRNFEQTV